MGILRIGRLPAVFAIAILAASAASPVRGQGDLTAAELALIAPPDLSSPRATLASLQTSVNQAYATFAEAYDQYIAEPGLSASPEVDEKIDTVNLLLRRAMTTLDLSEVPAVNREQTGIEVTLLLGEILDRLPPIDLETVPDAAAVAVQGMTAWTLPNTEITIVRLGEGRHRAGQFVFSADSVDAARDLYDSISLYGGRVQSGTDLYRFYTLTPGDLLPPKWLLWIHDLPFWARDSFFLGHALWQWVGMLLTVLVLFGGWWAVVRLRRRSATSPSGRGFASRLVAPVLLAAVALITEWVIVRLINVSGSVLLVAVTLLEAIIYLAAAWAAYLVCAGIGERIAASSRIDRTSIDASLIRVAARVVGIAAAITVIFFGASEVGLPIYGIIAGLGVGGLALGLAARPTLENLIGGFILYADRPVRVGDFCRFGDKYGTIEEIGLRSTRIRALDRTLVTIPNAEFSNMQLINVSRRDGTLLDTVVKLRQDTSAKQMHAILEAIRLLLHADPDVDHDTARVRFQEVGDYALGIGVRAHMKPVHHSAFLEVQERILFGIIKIVEDHGAALALPAHRTYHMSERPQAPAGTGATADDLRDASRPEAAAAEPTSSQADDA